MSWEACGFPANRSGILPSVDMYSAYMPMVWCDMLYTGKWDRILFSNVTVQIVYLYGAEVS